MLLFPDSARFTGAFWWLAGTDLAPTQTRISESLKAESAVMGFASDHRGYDPPLAETCREPLGSSSRTLPRIRKPRLPGRDGQTKLARLPRCRRPEMVTVPNLLAGVDVDPDCHQTILATQ
jgi:hypothetical protein